MLVVGVVSVICLRSPLALARSSRVERLFLVCASGAASAHALWPMNRGAICLGVPSAGPLTAYAGGPAEGLGW